MISDSSDIIEKPQDFRAEGSWDYVILEPIVLNILSNLNYPSIISVSKIEDQLSSYDVSPAIDSNRIKHCISRVLGLAGYKKRSQRGNSWVLINLNKIIDQETRIDSPGPKIETPPKSNEEIFLSPDEIDILCCEFIKAMRPSQLIMLSKLSAHSEPVTAIKIAADMNRDSQIVYRNLDRYKHFNLINITHGGTNNSQLLSLTSLGKRITQYINREVLK